MDPKLMTDSDNTTTAYPSSLSLYARYLNNRKSKESRPQEYQKSYTSSYYNILKSSSSSLSSSSRSSAFAKKMSTSPRSTKSISTSAMATINNYLRSASMLQTSTTLCLILLISTTTTCQAFLYQPINYMLDDSALISNSGSGDDLDHVAFSPIHNDQTGSNGDKDIATIIGEGLARWRDARMLNQRQQQQVSDSEAEDQLVRAASNYESSVSPNEAHNGAQNNGDQQQSVSSAVAEMLINGMSAIASSASSSSSGNSNGQSSSGQRSPSSIVEIDTSSSSSSGSEASKADLKGTRQWFNPKDNIPALRISSMATPSKHKKVYFRSEKKLYDDSMEKPSLMKPFNGFSVQRRSSRGSSSAAAPQSLFQNGVIDFLKKFRDVYIQTRPITTASGSASASAVSAASSLATAASNMMAAAASSPTVVSALSPSSSSSSSGTKPALASASGAVSSGASTSGGLFGGASSGPNKSSLTSQKYMSFWSKQFPTWVRKVLKQIRRSTLKASQNKRQHQQQTASAIGQASASGAVSSVVENSAHNANQH